jgi:tetratricopeptide (TPR) repeat protein
VSFLFSEHRPPSENAGGFLRTGCVGGREQPMLEKSIGEVQPRWRELYRSGLAALEKNDRCTAIGILGAILEQEPGFFQCRQSLHAARIEGARLAQNSIKRAVEDIRAVPWLAEAELCLKSRPARAIHAAEQALNHDPGSVLAHKVLAKAALAVGLPRTALLSLDFLFQHEPENEELAVELATALAETGDLSRAIATCGRLLKERPRNKAGGRLMRRLLELVKAGAGTRQTLASNGCKGIDRSANAIIKATGQQQGFPNPKADTVQGQILELEALLRHGPNNHMVLKRLGALYATNSNFDRALEYYWRALHVAHGADAESERAIKEIGDLKQQAIERARSHSLREIPQVANGRK